MIISAAGISIYKPVHRTAQAAIIQAEAIAATELNDERTRVTAAAKTFDDARQKFQQTQHRKAPVKDQQSGCFTGPTPGSPLIAQKQYRRFLDIVV